MCDFFIFVVFGDGSKNVLVLVGDGSILLCRFLRFPAAVWCGCCWCCCCCNNSWSSTLGNVVALDNGARGMLLLSVVSSTDSTASSSSILSRRLRPAIGHHCELAKSALRTANKIIGGWGRTKRKGQKHWWINWSESGVKEPVNHPPLNCSNWSQIKKIVYLLDFWKYNWPPRNLQKRFLIHEPKSSTRRWQSSS